MLTPRPFPDTRPSLLSTLRGGDASGSDWRAFFEFYAPAVYRVARRRGLDEHDADDMVQQVMLAVSGHIGDFEYARDRGRFRDWVRRVTENKVNDLLRERLREPAVRTAAADRLKSDAPGDDAAWAQEWQVQDMLHCLKRIEREIAPNRFEAFRLYALEGLTAEEVGQRVGMTRAHVYVTRMQVVRRLRELMRRMEGGGSES